MIAIVLIATINTKAQNKIKGRVVEQLKDGSEIQFQEQMYIGKEQLLELLLILRVFT